MDTNEHDGQQRDVPRLRERVARWLQKWGADLLLIAGGGCLAAGAAWIYPPAGPITAGVLLIAGGILWARGGDSG